MKECNVHINIYYSTGRHSEQQLQLHQYSNVGDGVGAFWARPLDVCLLRTRVPPPLRRLVLVLTLDPPLARLPSRAPFVLALGLILLLFPLAPFLTDIEACVSEAALLVPIVTGAGAGSVGTAGQVPEMYWIVLLLHTSTGISPNR